MPRPVPTYPLTGLIFVDLDGDGHRAAVEPPAAGIGLTAARLDLPDHVLTWYTTSATDGSYRLNLWVGNYAVDAYCLDAGATLSCWQGALTVNGEPVHRDIPLPAQRVWLPVILR